VQISASTYDKGYVGSVDGQVLNENPSVVMSSAVMTVVLLDANGDVVGGGSGRAVPSLPTGGRGDLSASPGGGPVPIARAAAVPVTVQPTFGPAAQGAG